SDLTFVEGRGSTLLANHGTQRLEEADASEDGRSLRARVRWTAHDGHDLLTEQRTLTTAVLPEAVGWSLHWHSTLEAGAEPLRITSPATRGRPGAGYSTRILVAEGQGEGLAHGSTGEALIVQRRHGRAWSSLVLVQDAETQGRVDPWFVRASDYVGIGPSLAWDQARDVARGESLEISLRMVMLDRRASIEEIPELLAAPADRA